MYDKIAKLNYSEIQNSFIKLHGYSFYIAKSRDCARPDQLYDMEQICLIQNLK